MHLFRFLNLISFAEEVLVGSFTGLILIILAEDGFVLFSLIITLKLPNIREKGFIKTYTSNKMVKIKRAALVKKYGLCKKCTIGNADFLGFNVDLRKKRNKK